jgi:hypothetical protein
MREAEELIRSSDLSLPVSKEKLVAALIPRVGFSSYPWMARGLPLGASRFGGPADLPAGVEWPRVRRRPMLLLAQLNFGALPIKRDHPVVKQLPERGWLCLFLDVDGDGNLRDMGGDEPGVVALQFNGDAAKLIRHDPEPAPDAETWTHCHAATVYPADHHLCLPDLDAVDSPLPERKREKSCDAYDELKSEIEDLARTRHEVSLLGTPNLFNPDLRHPLQDPGDWMLLLQFNGDCSFLAGVTDPSNRHLRQPSFGSADYVQYFVTKADYEAGRLDRGFLGYTLT